MAVSKELLKKIRQLAPGKNKYHNKNTSCLSKHIHQSKAEANYCNLLLARKQSGEIVGYLIQYPFVLVPGIGSKPGVKHVVDFLVMLKGWAPIHGLQSLVEAHEVKGFKTGVWKIKSKLFREKYPEIPYIIIDKKEETDGRGRQAGTTGRKKAVRSEGRARCDHGEGLKRKGVCVICSGLARREG